MDFVALVQQCAPWASPQTMASIVKRESGFKPLSIGINGGARLVRQPSSKDEAVATARWLIERGYNIDMGLAQINSKNLTKLNLSIHDVFDGCRNIAAAATLLSWNFESAKSKVVGEQQALLAAISTYNTGNMVSGFKNGYVQGVVANAGIAMPREGSQQTLTPVTARPPVRKSSKTTGAGAQDPKAVRYVKEDGTIGQASSYALGFD